jgi:hypothetical protein
VQSEAIIEGRRSKKLIQAQLQLVMLAMKEVQQLVLFAFVFSLLS